MKFLVIGFGSIGARHARNLATLGHECGIVDPDPSRREAAARELSVEVFASIEAALASGEWAGGLVASPSRYHIADATRLARADLDVFIEKPLSTDLTGIQNLVESLAARNRFAMLGFNLRFHPAFVAARRLVGSAAIGRVLHARATYGHYLPQWRPQADYRRSYSSSRALGGGVLLDVAHEIDYLSWLVSPPRSVTAVIGQPSDLDVDVETVADVLFEFENGALGSLHLDSLDRRYSRSFTLTGSKGTLEWSWGGPLKHFDGETEIVHSFDDFDFNETYVDELRAFAQGIRARVPPDPTLADGVLNIRAIRAIRRAAALRRTVDVDPFDPVVAIVQARMGSARLPGKSMLEVGGDALVKTVVDRVRGSLFVDAVVVATTDQAEDDALAAYLRESGVDVVRGSAEDVLARYHLAATVSDAEHIVRITADDALKDPDVVDHVVKAYLEPAPRPDYASNTITPSYPEGLDVEVFSRAALETAAKEAILSADREHVTPFIWKDGVKFRLVDVRHDEDLSHHRWTIDYEDDLLFIREIFARLGPRFGWREVLDLLEADPELAGRRTLHVRNEGYLKSVSRE